jgi:integrase
MASFRKRGRVWYYAFINADGRRVERKGCTDKRSTEELARAAESEAAKVKAGLVDARELARREHESRPIQEHVDAWAQSLSAKGGTPRHVSMSLARVRRLAAVIRGAAPSDVEYPRTAKRADLPLYEARLAGWLASGRLADLTTEGVQKALAALRSHGMSLQSLNHYRAAVRSFAIWCHDTNRMRESVLRGVKTYNAKEDRRHDRRTIGVDELHRLIEAARVGPVVLGAPGPTRALCYRLAVSTGLRYSEIQSVTPESFDWTADPITVAVSPAYTKNGEAALMVLPDDLADDLRPYVASVASGEPVFPLPTDRGAEMLRADLAAAGIPYMDASGRYFDFHSLRCQTATLLDAAGVSPRVAQRIMRHSTPGLTDRYTKPRAVDVERAALSLPSLRPSETAQTASSVLSATGTDDLARRLAFPGEKPSPPDPASQWTEGQPISKDFAAHLPHAGDVSGRDLSHPDVMTVLDDQSSMWSEPRKTGALDAKSRLAAASVASDRAGTRTQDQRINIPHRLSPTNRPIEVRR